MGEGTLGANKISWDDQFIIVDKNGGSFHSYYEGIDGHPFFLDKFKASTIKLVSGEVFSNVAARLDLYKQIVQLKLNGDTVKTVLPGNISQIIFYDTVQSTPYSYTFQTGYPEIDKLTKNNFYQVLSQGRITMLRSSVKKINKLKNEMTGELSSQFDVYEEYYLYVKFEMKKIKKDKEFILGLLPDKRQELEIYINKEKINFKSIESINKVIEYYNSISGPQF